MHKNRSNIDSFSTNYGTRNFGMWYDHDALRQFINLEGRRSSQDNTDSELDAINRTAYLLQPDRPAKQDEWLSEVMTSVALRAKFLVHKLRKPFSNN
jgi:hypothetical protein